MPNLVPDQLASLFGYPLERSSYASEGGDKSFNGKGTVLMSKAVETQRNPTLTLDQIEATAKEAFHVRRLRNHSGSVFSTNLSAPNRPARRMMCSSGSLFLGGS